MIRLTEDKIRENNQNGNFFYYSSNQIGFCFSLSFVFVYSYFVWFSVSDQFLTVDVVEVFIGMKSGNVAFKALIRKSFITSRKKRHYFLIMKPF